MFLHPLRPSFWRRFRFCRWLCLGPDELNGLLDFLGKRLQLVLQRFALKTVFGCELEEVRKKMLCFG